MNKKGAGAVLGIMALLLGVLLAMQIGSNSGTEEGGLIPAARLSGLEQELKTVRAEKEAVLQELLDVETKLSQLEKESISEDTLLQQLMDEVDRYKMFSGLTDVTGPGVVITIDDPVPTEETDGYSVIMTRYDLLLAVVNKLKEAGAEALSVNGQRIINTTEISLAGNNVNINATPTAPPYVIKAIGDPEILEATMTIRYGVLYNMKETYGLQVSIAKQEALEIPRYSGVLRFRYAEPVAE